MRLALILCSLLLPMNGSAAGPKAVSLAALIANPEKYDGQKLRVVGYLRLEDEGNALYLHEEDAAHALYKNGLWANIGEPWAKTPEAFDRRYVLLEATFDAKDTGHMGLWSGALKDFTRCEAWSPVQAQGMKPYLKKLKSP